MHKITTAVICCLLWLPVMSFAHHPAEDMVDEEIYAVIDEMVSDTPHADLEFIDMGSIDMTIITTDTVSAAEDLIQEGLLADISLLDGVVTVSIEFIPEEAVDSMKLILSKKGLNNDGNDKKSMKWSEWGGPVKITVLQDCTACSD